VKLNELGEKKVELNKEYGQSGGQSASTQDIKRAAVGKLDIMLMGIGEPAFRIYLLDEKSVCDKAFFSKFCDFLVNHATARTFVNEGEKKLSAGTATQYLSSIKEKVKNTYPDHILWKSEPVWYSKLRLHITTQIVAQLIAEGKTIAKTVTEIGRVWLGFICLALIRCLWWSKSAGEAGMVRLIFIMLFSAVGRSAEVATTSWQLAYWDHERSCLTMRWSCPKTFHQKTINFFIDYKDYKMCFYHALAVYFMTANGTERAAQYHRGYEFIFPQLAKQNIAGVHWTITMWIQSMSRTSTTRNFPAKVHVTLPADMTGKSLRKGAINMLHTRNMPVLTHRSGHSVVPRGFEGNRAYNYVDESLPEVEEGGRLLAGKDFHDNDAIPSLAVVKASLSVEQNKGLQAFIMDLFQTHANPRFGPE
jgi:hypothetical protein